MLKIRHFSIVLSFGLLGVCLSSVASGQQWSGLLAPNRAIDWSNAGAGSIPARTGICQTLGVAGQSSTYAQNVTAGDIQNALLACAGSNQAVYLNPGTYTMTQTMFTYSQAAPSNVSLRGAGPTKTILSWSSSASLQNCDGIGPTAMCVYNGDSGTMQYSSNILTITGGVSNGSTSLTLGSAASGYPGSISNLKVGSLLAIDQNDDPLTDNGNWWECGQGPVGSTGYCTWGGVSNAWGGRTLSQIVTVTAISGNTVTISPGLYGPKWSQNNAPYAMFSSNPPVTGFGLESLQLNTQQLGDIQAMFELMWATNSWVKNVSFINNDGVNSTAARKHLEIASSAHITVRDSYMFGSSPSSEGYGVDFLWGTSDSLAENNISQHIASGYILETGMGDVFGYNYAVDNFYTGNGGAPNWQQCDAYHHDAGDTYDLWEGQEGICAAMDDGHGTSFGLTYFRNYFNGHDPATTCPPSEPNCGTQQKLQATMAVGAAAYSRYNNLVGNVLGTSTYHNTYKNVGVPGNPNTCTSYPWTVIYSFGFANGNQLPFSPACTSTAYTLDNDALVWPSSMFWGNYDTVNASVQTNSSESASNASTYPGLASPSTNWSSYPSFYLSAKPSWWGTMPWPAVGPEITGGNIANVGGHANHNPAANCFLNVLGGHTDGSSGVLNFDANSCYSNAPASSGGGPAAPLNLTGTLVQ